MDSLKDLELIYLFLNCNDHTAFKYLVIRYQADLRGLFLSLTSGDQSVSDDLAQETFIRVYKYLKSFKGQSKFSTWLYRIAYNVFKSYMKKNKIKIQTELIGEEFEKGFVDDQSELRLLNSIDLFNALKRLRKEEKIAISLAYNNNMTHKEISFVMGIPLGTVKTHISRGKEKLKSWLQ